MNNYLNHNFNPDDPDLISVIDELPLWAAPFGLSLLDTIKLKPGINALDVGCGLGFPLIELSQRLGTSSKVHGIDPWESAIKRINLKIKTYNLKNVIAMKGVAEELPFDNNFFDLIVSNNGINNVADMYKSLNECSRVCKQDAQFTFTLNLEDTMIEFYSLFEETLIKNNLIEEVKKMREQIYSKRKPLAEIKKSLSENGFEIKNIKNDSFTLKFLDGATIFNHSLIKYWFLDGWKKILKTTDLQNIFEQLENKLDSIAKEIGELSLTVPFVTIDCRKI
ncbi:MAG: methyltransferase domain-containing protein [Ignavibacteria bacterium]|nr:methyltransferase domain-containing protein [Ignavibacteria bacterium]